MNRAGDMTILKIVINPEHVQKNTNKLRVTHLKWVMKLIILPFSFFR
jgi:hypothetical protein